MDKKKQSVETVEKCMDQNEKFKITSLKFQFEVFSSSYRLQVKNERFIAQ
jgi:hypothetical protein